MCATRSRRTPWPTPLRWRTPRGIASPAPRATACPTILLETGPAAPRWAAGSRRATRGTASPLRLARCASTATRPASRTASWRATCTCAPARTMRAPPRRTRTSCRRRQNATPRTAQPRTGCHPRRRRRRRPCLPSLPPLLDRTRRRRRHRRCRLHRRRRRRPPAWCRRISWSGGSHYGSQAHPLRPRLRHPRLLRAASAT